MPGGLEARVSNSFEESDVYNFLELEPEGAELEIRLAFQRYTCQGVACVNPVDAIALKGVEALIVFSISDNFVFQFENAGTPVFLSSSCTVRNAAEFYLRGNLSRISVKKV